MIETVEASSTDIYEAVVVLSHSIAARSYLESPLSGVGESVRRIVGFDYVGLTLHDRKSNVMQGHFLRRPEAAAASLACPSIRTPLVGYWSISVCS